MFIADAYEFTYTSKFFPQNVLLCLEPHYNPDRNGQNKPSSHELLTIQVKQRFIIIMEAGSHIRQHGGCVFKLHRRFHR